MKILKINSSVRSTDSVTRQLVEELIGTISSKKDQVIERDLAKGVSLLTEETLQAFYATSETITEEQKELLVESDKYIKEIAEAEAIVIGAPLYNFSVPASLKAYFDQIARVGVTFKYTENGPVGLLEDKKVFIVMASGGVAFKSEADYLSDYMVQFLNFLGMKDISFIEVDQLMGNEEHKINKAKGMIAVLSAVNA